VGQPDVLIFPKDGFARRDARSNRTAFNSYKRADTSGKGTTVAIVVIEDDCRGYGLRSRTIILPPSGESWSGPMIGFSLPSGAFARAEAAKANPRPALCRCPCDRRCIANHRSSNGSEVLVGSFSHRLWRFIFEVRSHSTPTQGSAESAPLAPLFWRQVLSFFQPANRSV
jgi:hypothetical protein